MLARSWFGAEQNGCELAAWRTACPTAGDGIEVKGLSMAVLVSDND